MKIVLISENFPPLRNSGAVQLRDLSREFVRQHHSILVLVPSPSLDQPWRLEDFDGVQVLRLKAPRTKDVGYVRRTLAELYMPFAMLRHFRKTPFAGIGWDGVVWYSPSIFHGPLVSALKHASGCRSYLILRDIFPEWAADVGLMSRGLPYLFFDAIARYQYSVADVIGVQTAGNKKYFNGRSEQYSCRVEVLQNWLDSPGKAHCSIRINETQLAGRKIFVYAGNMGVAQGMGIFLDLAEKLSSRTDVGILFVGRGSDAAALKSTAQARQLNNVIFFDEIHPDEIPDLYAQCAAGIVALDYRHKSHNIPGKFLTYMQCGLPALANVNAGNDLAKLIRDERVGRVCESNQLDELLQLAVTLLAEIETDSRLPGRCIRLFEKEFLVEKAVNQIALALSNEVKEQP